MAVIVSEFFGIMGVDVTPPTNMAELIPYLLTVVISIALVSGVFRVFGKLADWIMNFRRW